MTTPAARMEVYAALRFFVTTGDATAALDEMHSEVVSAREAIALLTMLAGEAILRRFEDDDDPVRAAADWLDQQSALAQQEESL